MSQTPPSNPSSPNEVHTGLGYAHLQDTLTGLVNRRLLHDRLAKSLAVAKRQRREVAVILVDIDHFSSLTHQHGQSAEALILRHMAAHFSATVRNSDTVARIGKDEFVLVLENPQDPRDIEDIARTLVSPKPLVLPATETTLTLTAAAGISRFPQDGESVEALLRSADAAVVAAKARGVAEVCAFDFQRHASAPRFLLLENDLRDALASGQIEVVYQPQLSLEPHVLVGVEVLCRWRHPVRGMLSPGEFLDIAEETPLMMSLNDFVLARALDDYRDWVSQGISPPRLSVNVTAYEFRRDSFTEQILRRVREAGLSPSVLELELTESTAMENPHRALELLAQLQSQGVGLALDDFGTGYSSLAYLRRFPVTKLKMDKVFIQGIPDDMDDAVTAKAIIELGHNLSMTVLAEGVETAAQAQWLSDNHCDAAQGYWFSRGLTSEEFVVWVGARKG